MLRLEKQHLMPAFLACAMAAAWNTTALAQTARLLVDPYSGAVSIQNNTASALSLDGYQITSNSGALVPGAGGWNSLTSQGLPGWQTESPSATALSELNLSSSTSIAPSGTLSLGNAFHSFGTQDIQFGDSVQNGSNEVATLPAPVSYTGGFQLQVITLLGGPSNTVQATPVVLYNPEPVSMNIDGYQIQSASGSLNPAGFNGFAGHSVSGWQSVGPSANNLAELNLTSSTVLAPLHDQVLGSAFTAGGMNDLSFQFHLVGYPSAGATPTGTVVYSTQLAGDANNDHIVNGLDIALIASNWLHTGTLPGDANYDGIVNGLDIALVASNWLHTMGGGGGGGGSGTAVPEPSALGLMVTGLALGACGMIRRRRGLKR